MSRGKGAIALRKDLKKRILTKENASRMGGSTAGKGGGGVPTKETERGERRRDHTEKASSQSECGGTEVPPRRESLRVHNRGGGVGNFISWQKHA